MVVRLNGRVVQKAQNLKTGIWSLVHTNNAIKRYGCPSIDYSLYTSLYIYPAHEGKYTMRYVRPKPVSADIVGILAVKCIQLFLLIKEEQIERPGASPEP